MISISKLRDIERIIEDGNKIKKELGSDFYDTKLLDVLSFLLEVLLDSEERICDLETELSEIKDTMSDIKGAFK